MDASSDYDILGQKFKDPVLNNHNIRSMHHYNMFEFDQKKLFFFITFLKISMTDVISLYG